VVSDAAPRPEGLDEYRLPAGPYATVTHVGPYAQLGDVWSRLLREWLPARGRRLGPAPSHEIYRNTPVDVPPEQLVTELYLPLA
jgi:AraC family transcriptional regulator